MKNMGRELITKWDELLADINLFLCEHYGYKDSAYFNIQANGCTLDASSRAYYLYIRFWEFGGEHRGLPDKIVILVSSTFKKGDQGKQFTNLLRFLKAYAPIYGYEYICIEDRVDGLDKTCYGFPKTKDPFRPYGPMKIADLILPEE